MQSWDKPLPTMEELNKLLEEGTDAELWEAIQYASLNDVFIDRSLAAGDINRWQRQRTLMLMVLAMAIRHKALFDQFVEKFNMMPMASFQVRTDGNGKIIDIYT